MTTHQTKSDSPISISGAINRPATSFGRTAAAGRHRCTHDLLGDIRHAGSGTAAAPTVVGVRARGDCRPNAGHPAAECPAATAAATASATANAEPPPSPPPPPSPAAADVHGSAVRGEGAP